MAHAARVGILALVASVMSVVSGKGTLWEPNPFFFFFFFPSFWPRKAAWRKYEEVRESVFRQPIGTCVGCSYNPP